MQSAVLSNKRIDLSVIITNYNKLPYLNYLIEFVKSYYRNDNVEFIFIDDNSKDGSQEQLKRLEKVPNCRLIFNSKNYGIGFCRNKGLREARGKFISFVDGDDIIMNNYCSEIHSAIIRYGIYSDKPADLFHFPIVSYPDGELYGIQDSQFCINKVYSKDFLIKNELKFKNVRRDEDYLFNAEVFACNPRIHCISKVLYLHNKMSDGLSHSSVLKQEGIGEE